MHLTKLKITGFKSFKNPTVIENLSRNVNIVIGRNGSGKSSIISAFEFLLHIDYVKLNKEDRKSLINEGNFNDKTAEVEGYFDNSDGRFPAGSSFILKRILNRNVDETYLDGKLIKKDELFGLFENAGFSKSNSYFIVPQGRINYLASISDQERFSLIKEIAGVNVYENDRENALKFLKDAEIIENKINSILRKIKNKMKNIEKNQEIMKKLEKLEYKKKMIQNALDEIELKEIENQLKDIKLEPVEIVEEDEDDDEISLRIRQIQSEIDELEKERYRIIFESQNIRDRNAIEKFNKLDDLEIKIITEIEKLKHKIELLEIERNENDLKLKSKEIEQKFKNQKFTKEEILKLLEEKKKQIKNFDVNNEKIDLRDLIKRRKELWVEEKRCSENLKQLKNNLGKNETDVIMKHSVYNAYQEIKKYPGVHGCVFELFSAPEELMNAIESVLGSSLLNIVVDNEDTAIQLLKIIKCRATFLPINRINSNESSQNIDTNIIPLHTIIETEYKNIFKYLCKNTYLVSDLKSGSLISKNYKVNTVTVGGDFISKKGIMAGGYDNKKNNSLRTLKNNFEEMKNLELKLESIKNEIKEYDLKIKQNEYQPKNTDKTYIKAFILFLEEKLINLNKNKLNYFQRKSILNVENLNLKKIRLMQEITKNQIELEKLKYKNEHLKIEKQNLKSDIKKIESLKNKQKIDIKIQNLKNQLQILNEKFIDSENKQILKRITKTDFETENMNKRKSILIEKRKNILNRLSLITFENPNKETKKENLHENLKKINNEIQNLPPINKNLISKFNDFIIQKQKLLERKYELEKNKLKIIELLDELDKRKFNTLELTFNMINNNFRNIYYRFTGKIGYFCKFENKLIFMINDLNDNKENIDNKNIMNNFENNIDKENIINIKELSGGQKTLLSLALIFAIQRVDPSPFYFFDEIDANLDQESRIKISNFISELKSQFLITTFKEEMLNSGNKFYHVKFENKESNINEINKEEAIKELNF